MALRAVPALTVKQPWASLIMLGIKDIENRSWITEYRGPIFIHAGQKWDPDHEEPLATWLREHHFTEDSLPKGAILGTVDLIEITTGSKSPWAIKGQFHWVIKNPSLLDQPVFWRGQMGLWRPVGLTPEANT